MITIGKMNRSIQSVPNIVFEYFGLIEVMESTPGMYHLDKMRKKLHEEISKKYNVDKKVVSDALELFYPKDAHSFHIYLLDSQLATSVQKEND